MSRRYGGMNYSTTGLPLAPILVSCSHSPFYVYGEMLIQRKYMIKEGKRGIRRQIMSPFMSSEIN
jgi:hypothetical protein